MVNYKKNLRFINKNYLEGISKEEKVFYILLNLIRNSCMNKSCKFLIKKSLNKI